MAAPIALRADFDAGALRLEARRSRDAAPARPLLAPAPASICDGGSRSAAARIVFQHLAAVLHDDAPSVDTAIRTPLRWTCTRCSGIEAITAAAPCGDRSGRRLKSPGSMSSIAIIGSIGAVDLAERAFPRLRRESDLKRDE